MQPLVEVETLGRAAGPRREVGDGGPSVPLVVPLVRLRERCRSGPEAIALNEPLRPETGDVGVRLQNHMAVPSSLSVYPRQRFDPAPKEILPIL